MQPDKRLKNVASLNTDIAKLRRYCPEYALQMLHRTILNVSICSVPFGGKNIVLSLGLTPNSISVEYSISIPGCAFRPAASLRG